jgi:predicted CoA-binding protein
MDIKTLFEQIKTIAIVGLSDKPERASYSVAMYFIDKGYRVIPVNPNIAEFQGEKSYATLEEIPETIKIDLVDIFRKSEEVLPIVKKAHTMGIKNVWLQEGVTNQEAIVFAKEKGMNIWADICLMKEHRKV